MTNPMLAELDEVVRLRDAAEYENVYGSCESFAEADKAYKVGAASFIATHHATLADMAKRLEAAERDAARYALIKKRFDDMTTGKSERFLECLGIDGDVYQPLDAAIDATQEGEAG